MKEEEAESLMQEEVYTDREPSPVVSSRVNYSELVNCGSAQVISVGPCYKTEWENFPEFRLWLRPVPNDETKAWCRACEKMFKADLKSLRVHGVGRSHARMVQSKFPDENVTTAPAVAYNIITDKKGTYGIGIISRSDAGLPASGNTLYVNPTNPNSSVLTTDPNYNGNNCVVVSIPFKRNVKKLTEPQEGNVKEITNGATTNKHSIKPCKIHKRHSDGQNVLHSKKKFRRKKHLKEDITKIQDTEQSKIKCRKLQKQAKQVENDQKIKSIVVKIPQRIIPHYKRPVVAKPAKFWEGKAVLEGKVIDLKSTDFLGKYLVLFFYTQDFSKISTQEINNLSEKLSKFKNLNTRVVACSTDSHFVHEAWSRFPRSRQGVEFPKFPLLSDCTLAISKAYRCYIPRKGYCSPAYYIIDKRGILRQTVIYDLLKPRSIDNILRLVHIFQCIDVAKQLAAARAK